MIRFEVSKGFESSQLSYLFLWGVNSHLVVVNDQWSLGLKCIITLWALRKSKWLLSNSSWSKRPTIISLHTAQTSERLPSPVFFLLAVLKRCSHRISPFTNIFHHCLHWGGKHKWYPSLIFVLTMYFFIVGGTFEEQSKTISSLVFKITSNGKLSVKRFMVVSLSD